MNTFFQAWLPSGQPMPNMWLPRSKARLPKYFKKRNVWPCCTPKIVWNWELKKMQCSISNGALFYPRRNIVGAH